MNLQEVRYSNERRGGVILSPNVPLGEAMAEKKPPDKKINIIKSLYYLFCA
jgi:hypothetical protein